MSKPVQHISMYKRIGQQLLDYHSIDILHLFRRDIDYWICRLAFKNESNGKLIYFNMNVVKFMLGGYRHHECIQSYKIDKLYKLSSSNSLT